MKAMGDILLVVDVQYGNTDSEEMQELKTKLHDLLKNRYFDHQFCTSFGDYPDSIYKRLGAHTGCDYYSDDDSPVFEVSHYACNIPRHTLAMSVHEFIHELAMYGYHSYPDTVYIAGTDTESSVLAIAIQLMDYNIRPVILEEYCLSHNGKEVHEAGITCLKNIIGEEQIIYGAITGVEDFLNEEE